MGKLRDNLENYVVRSTSQLLDELPDDRRDELGGLLSELEGRGARVAEAEQRIEELLARLERRSAANSALDAEIAELKAKIARAEAGLFDRDREASDQLEAERVRWAERERRLREELETQSWSRSSEVDAREAALARRIEDVAERERKLQEAIQDADRELLEREHLVAAREGALEAQSEDRFASRESELASAEEFAQREKHALERRSQRLTELESTLRARAQELEARIGRLRAQETRLEGEAEVAEERARRLEAHERQLKQREADLSSYVAKVQGSLRPPE